MEIGLSTANYYPQYDTEDIVSLYGSMGVRTCEIFLNTFSETREDYCKNLKEILDKYGMVCNSVHVMSSMMEPCLFDLHKRRRDDYLEIFKNTLRAINILGSDIYTFHGPTAYTMDNIPLSHTADCYDRIYCMAGEKDIRLAQENVWYLASGNISFIENVMDKMKEEMKFAFDIKQARRSGTDTGRILSVMGENIINLHLSDSDGEKSCLLPGKGNYDFGGLFHELEKRNYRGRGILEVYREDFDGREDLLKGIRHLAERL